MAKNEKKKAEAVTATLSTGTKVTGPQSVIDKLKVEADRKSADTKSSK